MSLTEKTVRGLSWSLVDRVFNQGAQFVIGIILARLLSPAEYGLTGMVMILFAIADTFIVTGFLEALMQKEDATPLDYSTVFITNIITALLFYGIFVLAGPVVSRFYNEPLLTNILLVMGISIFFSALSAVPRIPLLLKMDFRALAIVSVLATVVSGVAAIALAMRGYGVWSLVWRAIILNALTSLLLFIFGKPKLQWGFSIQTFRSFFNFSSRLMLSRLIDEIYMNIFNIFIGKLYSAIELGLYTRAMGYRDLPSKVLNNMIMSVGYPALLSIKDDNERLKQAYTRMIRMVTYVSFTLLCGMAAAADNFILGLIGPKWTDAIPYLQLLCIAGLLFGLRYLNLNLLIIKSRTDIYLKLEILTKILALPAILIGSLWGVKAMIVGLIVASMIDFYFTSSWSGRLIGYSTREQIWDIGAYFLLIIPISFAVYSVGQLKVFPPLAMLFIQMMIGFVAIIAVSAYFQLSPYLDLQRILLKKIKPAAIVV